MNKPCLCMQEYAEMVDCPDEGFAFHAVSLFSKKGMTSFIGFFYILSALRAFLLMSMSAVPLSSISLTTSFV